MSKSLAYLQKKYPNKLLTLEQVAAELGRSLMSIRDQASKDRLPIPTVKVGRLRRVDVERLAEYMDNLSEQAEQEWNKTQHPNQ